jgi:prophage regulatory protein
MKEIKMIQDRYIRIKELSMMLGIARSSIYRLMKEDKFPKQIKLTERTSVWRLSVIEQWVTDKEKASKQH